MRSALVFMLLALACQGEGRSDGEASAVAGTSDRGLDRSVGRSDPRLDRLFAELLLASNRAEVARIESDIWELWFEIDDPVVQEHLARGVEAMNRQDFRAALRDLDAVVAANEQFAEGWNRRATLFYLMGDFESSVEDIRRTLELEPRHFGALSGLALIRETQRRPFEALEALEKLMQIHPHMAQLPERVEQLTAQLGEAI